MNPPSAQITLIHGGHARYNVQIVVVGPRVSADLVLRERERISRVLMAKTHPLSYKACSRLRALDLAFGSDVLCVTHQAPKGKEYQRGTATGFSGRMDTITPRIYP